MKYLNKKKCIIIPLFFTIFICNGVPENLLAKEMPDTLKISFINGSITIKAQSIRLSVILEHISKEFKIKIYGLDHKKKVSVNFSVQNQSLEKTLRLLLREIDETSYAFEYKGDRLYSVSVVPELGEDLVISENKIGNDTQNEALKSPAPSKNVPTAGTAEEKEPSLKHNIMKNNYFKDTQNEEDSPTTVVKILRVLENSQAAETGLLTGDIIIEYNGIAINNTRSLINEVNHTESEDEINITVIRDDEYLDFNLSGGKIGVSVQTVLEEE